jgi:hypothetical protein
LLKVALNTINKQTKKTISNSWVVAVFTKYIPGDLLIQVTIYKLFACFIAYISTSLSEN